VKSSARLKLPHEGDCGERGAEAGDLYVVIHVVSPCSPHC
jgi:DnaJ-class molecular chaperone